MCIRDRDDTIRRLQAFADAGADVLYAPGLPSLDAIREVCACLLYTSDAADERSSVDLGGRRIIKKKNSIYRRRWRTKTLNNRQST